MSEVEKLRALLAEARAELHSIEALTAHPGIHHGKDAARLLSVLKRIDAALAEPVPMDPRSIRHQRVRRALLAAVPADGTISDADDVSRVNQIVAARDAARIEAKRLRFLLRCAEDALEVVSKKWTKPAFERGEYLPMIRSTLTTIRALPVPEDKP